MASTHKIRALVRRGQGSLGVSISVLELQRWKVLMYGILLASCAVSVYISARREGRNNRSSGD